MIYEHELVLKTLAYIFGPVLGNIVCLYQSANLIRRCNEGIKILTEKRLHVHNSDPVQGNVEKRTYHLSL